MADPACGQDLVINDDPRAFRKVRHPCHRVFRVQHETALARPGRIIERDGVHTPKVAAGDVQIPLTPSKIFVPPLYSPPLFSLGIPPIGGNST